MVEEPASSRQVNPARLRLGKGLHDLRVGQGWTLHQLADRVGMSVASLSAYERGTRGLSLDALATICRAYDELVADFLRGIYPYGSREPSEPDDSPGDGHTPNSDEGQS